MIEQVQPVINFPDKKTKTFSFVQLVVRGEPFIVFQNAEQKYHADIIRDFLEKNQIPYKVFGRDKIPERKGKDYELVGAGRVMILGNQLHIGSNSSYYEIYPNREHLEKVRSHLPSDLE